jgi:aspartate carbamoyltransferase catalytic subunit
MSNGSRHLLDIDSLADDDIENLISRACALAAGAEPQSIEGTVANLFYEPSTRTRISFEMAALRLGLQVVNMELEHTSAVKGESLEDTAATLAAMGVNGLVIRHPETGTAARLAAALPSGLQLINAGDGVRAHPSQALLDAATLRARGIETSGLKVAVIGDIRHSRVAASGLRLWPRLGVEEVRLAGPADLMPSTQPPAGVYYCDSLEEAVHEADVVMMLRIQRERMDRSGWPDAGTYHDLWGLKSSHLDGAAPDCVVMHPGPINRGIEIAAEVADGDRSLILEQVRMGVFMRMAIFEWLFRV